MFVELDAFRLYLNNKSCNLFKEGSSQVSILRVLVTNNPHEMMIGDGNTTVGFTTCRPAVGRLLVSRCAPTRLTIDPAGRTVRPLAANVASWGDRLRESLAKTERRLSE
ncbi:hypothetical protein EVAR_30513_1 [Eumeta japonica]|uniref:Uncharacterized protein n=1 Tax=Eumeta variegata TaxID=151549 RepID=A0A4C1VZK3_EUMVA|nr:hypothetical protein EVAR_30513_1 [Eumeta japonica]